MEFLKQLDDTSGAVKMPDSVVRLLNSRACRSAIMFGDPLSSTQTTALVDALKDTRLSFICAHGRPTLAAMLDVTHVHRLQQLHGGGSHSSQCQLGLSLHELRKTVTAPPGRLLSMRRPHFGLIDNISVKVVNHLYAFLRDVTCFAEMRSFVLPRPMANEWTRRYLLTVPCACAVCFMLQNGFWGS
eukprot:jgi/Botrbrau1/840/Bobra.0352s0034.1